MGQTVELLENALRAWEDLYLIDEAYVRASMVYGVNNADDLVGPIKHWRELRNHLLTIRGSDFDILRFLPSSRLGPDDILSAQDGANFKTLPLQLASWILSSRRVFQVSSELAQRFIAADYSNYKWSDLLWPFDAFIVSLEKPFTLMLPRESVSEVACEVEMLLVSSIFDICKQYPNRGEQDGFEVRPFITRMDGDELPREFLESKERERLNKDLIGKRWAKLSKRMVALQMRMEEKEPNGREPRPGQLEPFFTDKKGYIPDAPMMKILAGLCLYLEALPPGTIEDYHWHKPVPIKMRREVHKLITDGEQICRVEDFHVLSPDTITLFPETLKKGPAYAVTPHWRRAHYRRRRGQGNNPDAPRDVYVGPAKIHADQVPEGAVVGGAVSNVR